MLFRGAHPLRLDFHFPLMGFAYLINLDVAFSIWFFHLLGALQVGLYNRFGYTIGGSETYCSASPPMGWQGFGGFIVLVGWGLWMARDHLGDVFRKAFKGDSEVDDTGELVSYRTAVWGTLIGFVYIVLFLSATGMTPAILALFLFAVTVIYLGVTRIVIEGGLVFLRGPLIAQPFTAYTLGVSTMSPTGMASLAVSYAWFCDIKSFFMPAIAHAAKLSDALKLRRRAVIVAVCVALVVAVLTSLGYTLGMGYSRGAYNYGDWIFRGGAETPYNAMVRKMRNPFDTDWRRLFFLGAGATVMALLTFLRYRFTRWPLHPIGFPVAYTLPVRISAFSIFLAWAAKWLILRYGGIHLYRRVQPFFYGLIVGTFTGCGISFVVDMIWFPGRGHFIYGW